MTGMNEAIAREVIRSRTTRSRYQRPRHASTGRGFRRLTQQRDTLG